MELIIVTGMSGAGKSQTAKALEDMGFYCVDNIPPSIIPDFINLVSKTEGKLKKTAVVTDVRGGNSFSEIVELTESIKLENIGVKILFLDTVDDVLIHRYKENRRKHPLCDKYSSLSEAVTKERDILKTVRNKADYIIDTSYISVSQLKTKLCDIFSIDSNSTLKIQCESFGFKYGIDLEADLVFDVRCLPNPFYDKTLKHKTGLELDVAKFVMNSSDSINLLNKIIDFLECSVPLYIKEGKSRLTIAIGCTGGKHRSVVFAEKIASYLRNKDYDCVTIHRDIQKR